MTDPTITGGGAVSGDDKAIERGPEPASPLPWKMSSPWHVYPSEGINNYDCDEGCDGGCDDDSRVDGTVRCRQLDHCGAVVCDTYGLERFAAMDAAYIVHAANNWHALHGQLVAERVENKRLRELCAELVGPEDMATDVSYPSEAQP